MRLYRVEDRWRCSWHVWHHPLIRWILRPWILRGLPAHSHLHRIQPTTQNPGPGSASTLSRRSPQDAHLDAARGDLQPGFWRSIAMTLTPQELEARSTAAGMAMFPMRSLDDVARLFRAVGSCTRATFDRTEQIVNRLEDLTIGVASAQIGRLIESMSSMPNVVELVDALPARDGVALVTDRSTCAVCKSPLAPRPIRPDRPDLPAPGTVSTWQVLGECNQRAIRGRPGMIRGGEGAWRVQSAGNQRATGDDQRRRECTCAHRTARGDERAAMRASWVSVGTRARAPLCVGRVWDESVCVRGAAAGEHLRRARLWVGAHNCSCQCYLVCVYNRVFSSRIQIPESRIQSPERTPSVV